ncbi:MAG: twin-arginine translocation signal domain-containing protein [Verrucomicrobiae bacterium]|nr:twin-arginine translocation signal domain-containing protein [Verrucomicrobiae bacterium]
MTPSKLSRRHFLNRSSLTAAAAVAAPAINLITSRKSFSAGDSGTIVGEGEHRYEVLHNWAKLPDQFTWQITHNVAVDKTGHLYVIHEGNHDLGDHPAIFVFDPEGNYVRSFGQQFQGGGHGLEVREENGQEFLYVTGYQMLKFFAKLTLTGEVVWQKFAPMASGVYAEGEDTKPEKVWGRDRFMPTNFAFLPDGGYYVADGYGAWYVHRYDKDGNWVAKFGGAGKEDGQFNTPHGLWIDDREGQEPSVVVADRANKRLQWFSFDGEHRKTLDGFILPANIDRRGDLLLVPDLSARVTLLDKDDKLIHLGEDPEWRKMVTADKNKMRTQPDQWVSGKFVHPHDACFDADGNIFVAEWVATGRITKLRKVS